MKKFTYATALILLFASTHLYAKALICPFTDYFWVHAPTGYAILALSNDGNIIAAREDSTHFTLSCKNNPTTESGQAYLTVASDVNNLCTLHIKDGPYEMNPTVTFVDCIGKLKYAGIEHDWGTYNYKLKFTY